MTAKQFIRRPRVPGPKMPGGEIHLEPPPSVARPMPPNVVMMLLPGVMIAVSVGFIVISGFNTTSLMMGGMMAMSTVGMMVGGGNRTKSRAATDEERKDYLRYLADVRQRVRGAVAAQRTAQEWLHPDPEGLLAVARGPRLWERRPADAEFCQIRLGRGPQRVATRLVPPQTGPVEDLEPVSAVALRRLVRAHAVVDGLPVAVQLRSFPAIEVTGEPLGARALVRAALLQTAVFHPPDSLRIVVVTSSTRRGRWEWVKWLPHAGHPTRSDAVGPLRLVVGSLAEAERLLADDLSGRSRFTRNAPPSPDQVQVLIVIDGGTVTGEEHLLLQEGLDGVCLIDLSESLGPLAARRGLRLTVQDGMVGAHSTGGIEWLGSADGVGTRVAEGVARQTARFRVGTGGPGLDDQPLVGAKGLTDLLGLGDPAALNPAVIWRPRTVHDRLRIPLGLGADGSPVDLDIKEAAQEGMGPHGLVIGATGSGKSEVLRTIVSALALTHSSTALNFVLVDFKGGATFAGLAELPHTAAVITNLSDDLALVDRMRDALAGEMNRRQELLREAGNFASVRDYERARERGAALDPLPALLIVCDEFTEMLVQKPDFTELFVAIGRLGRSLSMHLLLASQRLEEGRLRGLDSHLSYRIGLKTFSPGESRAVLGVADAYELPSIPGSGYLKFDTTSMVRFKAAYVSGPYQPGRVVTAGGPGLADRRPRPFGTIEVAREQVAAPEPDIDPEPQQDDAQRTVLDVIVSRLTGQGPPAHEVWLPPLDRPPTLDQMLPPLEKTERGLTPAGWAGLGKLKVPLAVVDKPFEQRRDLMWLDLSGAGGHIGLAGGPQSGKSTLLRTLVSVLALTHTPRQVQCYLIDLGGGALGGLAGLPSVGAVATRSEPDLVRRTIAEMTTLIRDREQLFHDRGLDSMAALRRARENDPSIGGGFGDVFLMIDGWAAFRTEFEDLEPQVNALVQQGLAYGVHVVISAARWPELRAAVKDLLGTRIELRLGDPADSEIDRRTAAAVPTGRPGRGLTGDRLHFLAALPRIDGTDSAQDLAAGVGDLTTRIADAWDGPPAPRVRMLPEYLPYSALPAPGTAGRTVPIGINEAELKPVFLDFDADSHFVLFGDAECGKTTFLRSVIRGLTGSRSSSEARILMVDYRRTLLGVVPEEYLAGYAAASPALEALIADVSALMTSRMPGPDVTPEQLANRSWWTGAELFVLVDDYDLVSTGSTNPLTPLTGFLPQAKDLGLHLVICRRAGGAGRSMFESVMQRLKELGTPGVVMSGSRDEGALVGNVRPSPMPPGRGTMSGRRTGVQLVQLAAPDR